MRRKSKPQSLSLGRLVLSIGCLLFIVTCSGIALAAATASKPSSGTRDKSVSDDQIPEYSLGPGDRFRIRVWGYDNLEQEVFIPPSGVATVFPIGQIKAAGLTASELDKLVTNELMKYLKQKPEVTVIPLTHVHSQIYVLGEVGRPGLYPFLGKMTVLEAVTRAGNPTTRAAIQQVTITRPATDNPEKSTMIIVDLDSVIHKGEAANDIQLRPGDIIYVPDVISAAQRGR